MLKRLWVFIEIPSLETCFLFIEIMIFGATNFGNTQVNSWCIQTHPAPTVGSLIPPCAHFCLKFTPYRLITAYNCCKLLKLRDFGCQRPENSADPSHSVV